MSVKFFQMLARKDIAIQSFAIVHVMQTRNTRQICLSDIGTRSLSFNLEKKMLVCFVLVVSLQFFLYAGEAFRCVRQCCSVTQYFCFHLECQQ